MMSVPLVFAIAAAVSANAPLASGASLRQRSITVSASSFTEKKVLRLCRTELGRKPRAGLTQLIIYGDKGGPPLPKPTAQITYDHWRGLYDSAANSPNEIAEMISIGADAVLRMRDANGNINRRLLAGKDPLHIEVQGDQFDVVYLAFSGSGPYALHRVDAYIRASAKLKAEVGLQLLRVLQSKLQELEVSVSVRNDAWFIHEPTYPFFNPFTEALTPPTAEEYDRTKTLRCGFWSGTASCRLQ